VQPRRLGELVETAIAVEKPLVVAFQDLAGGRCSRPAGHSPGDEADDVQEREPPDDVIAHVELDELQDLFRGCVEPLVVAVVLVPVQDQVRRQDAPAGDRRDICDIAKRARIAQESNDAQVEERRPEATAGEGQPELCHGSRCRSMRGKADLTTSITGGVG
jgi:hypothetical protein